MHLHFYNFVFVAICFLRIANAFMQSCKPIHEYEAFCLLLVNILQTYRDLVLDILVMLSAD